METAGQEFPYYTLLRDLACAVTDDGVTHLTVRKRLLCGEPLPESARVDPELRGQDAVSRNECRGCRKAHRGLLHGFRVELESARKPAGSAGRRLSTEKLMNATPDELKQEVKWLEDRNLLTFGLCLLGAVLLASVGSLPFALILALFGSVVRLAWLNARRKIMNTLTR